MSRRREPEVRRYDSFDQDFETSADQAYVLPEGYRWIRTGLFARILSALVYGAAVAFAAVWCRLILRLRIRGKKALRRTKGGFFLYGNHTQPFWDVFIPALAAFPKRVYTVVSPANYGIPVIGKLLPYLGALPTSDSLRGIRALSGAVETRIREGRPVVVFPEAHVWRYYTGIRPFSDVSFRFPAKTDAPVFAMTVTYRKAGRSRRPAAELWLDGPFRGTGEGTREKAASLCEAVRAAMTARSRLSDCEAIRYEPSPAFREAEKSPAAGKAGSGT